MKHLASQRILDFVYSLAFRDIIEDYDEALFCVGNAFNGILRTDILPSDWTDCLIREYGSHRITECLVAFTGAGVPLTGDWLVHLIAAFCNHDEICDAMAPHLPRLIQDGWEYVKGHKLGEPRRIALNPRQYVGIVFS